MTPILLRPIRLALNALTARSAEPRPLENSPSLAVHDPKVIPLFPREERLDPIAELMAVLW